jgi:hypothetical protein
MFRLLICRNGGLYKDTNDASVCSGSNMHGVSSPVVYTNWFIVFAWQLGSTQLTAKCIKAKAGLIGHVDE